MDIFFEKPDLPNLTLEKVKYLNGLYVEKETTHTKDARPSGFLLDFHKAFIANMLLVLQK